MGTSHFFDLLADCADQRVFPAIDFPFSFSYGGRASTVLLPGWQRTVQVDAIDETRTRQIINFTDPATGLEVRCTAIWFFDFAAVDWVLHFTNTGQSATPIIERILPLDAAIPVSKDNVILHHSRGSSWEPADFRPSDTRLDPGLHLELTPAGGRSSDGQLPFFNLEWEGRGLVGAIGWSGRWRLSAERNAETWHFPGGEWAAIPSRVQLQAGQYATHLTLYPGETIRTPRILLIHWEGQDRMLGHNRMRRLIYAHYTPLLAGEKPIPFTQCNTWFPVGDDGNKATAENQIELLKAYQPLDIEYLVTDAGWYGGDEWQKHPGWCFQVGNWEPRVDTFPQGLHPVGQAAENLGIKYGLWFEPERAAFDTPVMREHPEWMISQPDDITGGLLNLGLPEVQQWMIDLVSRFVEETPLAYYRQDFNWTTPKPSLDHIDAPDRVGMTEIRYMEGLYHVWDTLLARYPALLIEGCASGGRRIDLESISRCHTYYKSDYWGDHTANQAMVYGLGLYLPGIYMNTPLFDLSPNPYGFRSILGGALCAGWDPCAEKVGPYPPEAFDPQLAKARIAEFKALRHLFDSDFYPLTPYSLADDVWIGYQFHREELGEGLVLCFRRANSDTTHRNIALHALEPSADYRVTNMDTGYTDLRSGDALQQPFTVEIAEAPGSVMFRYQRVES